MQQPSEQKCSCKFEQLFDYIQKHLAMHKIKSTNLVAAPSPFIFKFLFYIAIQQHSIEFLGNYYIGEWKEGSRDGEGSYYVKVGIE